MPLRNLMRAFILGALFSKIHSTSYTGCRVLEDAIDIGNGLFWGGDFEQLTSLIETHQTNVLDVKFFLGYSGWSPGQLEEELKLDSWIVSDQVSDALVFETNPELMWKEAMRSLGGRFSVYSNYPEDPRMN
jgi:putative transcriptional regulator